MTCESVVPSESAAAGYDQTCPSVPAPIHFELQEIADQVRSDLESCGSLDEVLAFLRRCEVKSNEAAASMTAETKTALARFCSAGVAPAGADHAVDEWRMYGPTRKFEVGEGGPVWSVFGRYVLTPLINLAWFTERRKTGGNKVILHFDELLTTFRFVLASCAQPDPPMIFVSVERGRDAPVVDLDKELCSAGGGAEAEAGLVNVYGGTVSKFFDVGEGFRSIFPKWGAGGAEAVTCYLHSYGINNRHVVIRITFDCSAPEASIVGRRSESAIGGSMGSDRNRPDSSPTSLTLKAFIFSKKSGKPIFTDTQFFHRHAAALGTTSSAISGASQEQGSPETDHLDSVAVEIGLDVSAAGGEQE